jgi:NAD(P)-dependent dehydrogenase (short-subunit alcohol dehydrogenase family)
MPRSFLESLFGLQDRTVVVIGGTGVLGGALCEGIAAAGAHVVVAGRSEERGAARVEAIREAGGEASFIAVDVESRDSIEELCRKAYEARGSVYGLLNGAGVNSAKPFFEISDEDWDRVLSTNLKATFQASQVFGRRMTEAGEGSIVNIGSVTSFRPLSKVFAYSASKAALLNFTRNVAREFAPRGVRVNCLCPGFFPAEQNRKILTPERTESIMRHTPIGRFGEPSELVGATLLLLAPNAGSFITGEAIYVDGGFTAMTI